MNRRFFFTALAGATQAAALPKPEPHQVRMRVLTPYCAACHCLMVCHGHSELGGDFFTCEAEWCPNFRVPVDVPTLAMPAADPAKVAAIREREREGEEAAVRRRREQLAADWEALHHPFPSFNPAPAFTPAVLSCPHCGIPQAEGNEGVFACPAGCRGVTIRIRSSAGPTLWGRRLDA